MAIELAIDMTIPIPYSAVQYRVTSVPQGITLTIWVTEGYELGYTLPSLSLAWECLNQHMASAGLGCLSYEAFLHQALTTSSASSQFPLAA